MTIYKPKVCHFTSVHPHTDIRIFHKECVSLAAADYEIHLVAVGAPNETIKGVHVHGVPKTSGGRINRMTQTVWAVYQQARVLNATIYHFHDPELIPIGLLLRAQGKHVIYDIHEDIPRSILMKQYLPIYAKPVISRSMEFFEDRAASGLSALVAATPAIGKRFQFINPRTVVINNYPLRDELHMANPIPWNERMPSIAYVGGISSERGIFQMVEAMEYVPEQLHATLELAGRFAYPHLQETVCKQRGWSCIHELGMLNRSEVAHLLSTVRAGLVPFLPGPNHTEAQPNKLFEYMSAGIPVIASDFPLWRDFIEKTGCGLVVDPLDARALARAITFLLTQPNVAEEMGRKGREAIEQWYNWENEATKLVQLYHDLCYARG